jgi:hypothetical protein
MICDKLGGNASTEAVEFVAAAEKSVSPIPIFDSFNDLSPTGFSLDA